MIDDQVNLEELEESKKRRTSQEAVDHDATPATSSLPDASIRIPDETPKQWVRSTRKWLGMGGRLR